MAHLERVWITHRTCAGHPLGLYLQLFGDTCHWLAADFDGPSATLDALAYLKAARAVGATAALEVSRSGIGAHVWIFFTGPALAATARALGSGLLREAIALRGRMDLAAYDRLFPSQDALPASGGIDNLIAAAAAGPLAPAGGDGLPGPGDAGTACGPVVVPGAVAPAVEVARLAGRVAPPKVGVAVIGLVPATASGIRPQQAQVVSV